MRSYSSRLYRMEDSVVTRLYRLIVPGGRSASMLETWGQGWGGGGGNVDSGWSVGKDGGSFY